MGCLCLVWTKNIVSLSSTNFSIVSRQELVQDLMVRSVTKRWRLTRTAPLAHQSTEGLAQQAIITLSRLHLIGHEATDTMAEPLLSLAAHTHRFVSILKACVGLLDFRRMATQDILKITIKMGPKLALAVTGIAVQGATLHKNLIGLVSGYLEANSTLKNLHDTLKSVMEVVAQFKEMLLAPGADEAFSSKRMKVNFGNFVCQIQSLRNIFNQLGDYPSLALTI